MDALLWLINSIGGGFAGAGLVGCFMQEFPETRWLAFKFMVAGFVILGLSAYFGTLT